MLVTRVILMLGTSIGSVRRAGELQGDDARLLLRVIHHYSASDRGWLRNVSVPRFPDLDGNSPSLSVVGRTGVFLSAGPLSVLTQLALPSPGPGGTCLPLLWDLRVWRVSPRW